MPFIVGQRWVSDTESELGLGTVIALDGRSVTLLFPATGDNRHYTRSDPPITRVIFNPGDRVTSHQGWQLEVERVDTSSGLMTYIGRRIDTGEQEVMLREMMLDSKLTFSRPQDRLFAGQLDRMERFALRYRARKYQSEQYLLASSGLRGTRTSLIPHQLHIARQVAQRHAPRVLLADEVGLGKTIEAGLIIHQQLLSGRASRVLIIVPESLQHQWLVEMLRRFNLHFALFDEERYLETRQDSENPFETEQLMICSLPFVLDNPQRRQQLTKAEWDLMVVDEAHHLHWQPDAPSAEYQAIEQLAQHIPGVLLLTATPEQLGIGSHFARLRLLDSNRFHDFQQFITEQQHYQPVAQAVTTLLSEAPLDSHMQDRLRALIIGQDIEPLLAQVNIQDPQQATAREQLITLLMDRHGTSRVLFRNSRSAIKGFPRRVLHTIALPMPQKYQEAIAHTSDIREVYSVHQQACTLLHPEQIYQRYAGESDNWWSIDPRVAWLASYAVQNRQHKIVVICAHKRTATELERVLREREGIRAAVFHEDLSIIERDRAAAWFASEEEGAQLLICSEIGSEGRNFQFASKMVMFDLPLNPDLLEQRIGRLDRIGQEQDIEIIVPCLEDSAQALLLRWYHQGLNAFEHTCPTGRTLFDEVSETLTNLLIAPPDPQVIETFIHHCHQRHNDIKQLLEQGRDRLLELHSHGGAQALALAQEIHQQDNATDLVTFALNLFDIIGINQDDRGDNLIVLTPSDHMLVPDFPGLPQDGCTITFDRYQALAREDALFITWEHPIIRHGLDLILSGNIGCCALSLLKNSALPSGTLLLELIYVVESQAPPRLQLNRFLPPTPLRLLLDNNGTNLADKVEFEHFNRQLKAVNRHNGSKLINAMQQDVHQLLLRGEDHIARAARTLIDEARRQATETLNTELARLTGLRAVNPAIRDDEVEALINNRQEVLACLDGASWRLDAIRPIVVTHH